MLIDDKDLLLMALMHERQAKSEGENVDAEMLWKIDSLISKIRLNGWIPVAMHKPSKADDVLVIDDGEVAVGYMFPISGEWYRVGVSEDIRIEPTLWMPIPKAPTGRREND